MLFALAGVPYPCLDQQRAEEDVEFAFGVRGFEVRAVRQAEEVACAGCVAFEDLGFRLVCNRRQYNAR